MAGASSFREITADMRLKQVAVYTVASGTMEYVIEVDVGQYDGDEIVKIAAPLLRDECAFETAVRLHVALADYIDAMKRFRERPVIEAATKVASLARQVVEWNA